LTLEAHFGLRKAFATAIETEEQPVKCLVYIDLNMVRAGVVEQPSHWAFAG